MANLHDYTFGMCIDFDSYLYGDICEVIGECIKYKSPYYKVRRCFLDKDGIVIYKGVRSVRKENIIIVSNIKTFEDYYNNIYNIKYYNNGHKDYFKRKFMSFCKVVDNNNSYVTFVEGY